MAVTKAKGRQQGAHYQIQTTADTIVLKESMGQDASFERELLKAWSKHKGYESAKGVLAKLPPPVH